MDGEQIEGLTLYRLAMAIAGCHLEGGAHGIAARHAAECEGVGVKRQPRRERSLIPLIGRDRGHGAQRRCRYRQRILWIGILKRVPVQGKFKQGVTCGRLIGDGTRQKGAVVDVGHGQFEKVMGLIPSTVGCHHVQCHHADVPVLGRAEKGAGGVVEMQPSGERGVGCQSGGGIGEAVIGVAKGGQGDLVEEGRPLCDGAIRLGNLHGGHRVARLYLDREGVGDRLMGAIGGGHAQVHQALIRFGRRATQYPGGRIEV